MTVPTKFWIVLPPADELALSNGASLAITAYTSQGDADSAAQKAAVVNGKNRVVLEAKTYASPTITPVMANVADPA